MHILLLNIDHFKKLKYDKQIYIVKNLTKSIVLFYINIHTIFYFLPSIINNEWNDFYIRYLGGVYVSTDLAGLLNVPNLSITTKFHHYATIILYTLVCNISVKNNNLIKLIVCYTIFSSFAFLVNLYLGLRFFIIKESKELNQIRINKIIGINRKLAYYSYLINCFLNWSIHLFFFIYCIIYNKFSLWYILYSLILIPIIKDDIILLNWLKI